ncbi:MAG: hypothetical protein KAS23_04955 [Anaerohalosphaera sp.]|nr:hypothetical protein [Anaerohalosphaera sp.]
MTTARLKKMIRKTLLWPDINVVSSQTLYQSLLGCIDLYETTKDEYWAEQCKLIGELICEHQNPDGGFDIGFQFVFGTNVYKSDPNESTSPELLSLYALYRYREIFNDESVDHAIEQAVNWILRFVYEVADGKYAIPYAPYSVPDAHIVNGTSFALPGLAYYCRNNPKDNKALDVVHGMVRFLKDELEAAPDCNGMYFRYFHRESTHFNTEVQKEKIDNYHVAQQIRYHTAVQRLIPSNDNLFIIENLSCYLLSRQDTDTGIISYCEDSQSYPRDIHTWGFSSCIKGFSSAYLISGDKRYREAAKKVLDWLLKYSYTGDYFYPILREDGLVIDDEFYVRNNAWVFHGMTNYLKNIQFSEMLYEICRKNYQSISGCNFKGYDIKIWNNRLIKGVRLKKRLFGQEAVV